MRKNDLSGLLADVAAVKESDPVHKMVKSAKGDASAAPRVIGITILPKRVMQEHVMRSAIRENAMCLVGTARRVIRGACGVAAVGQRRVVPGVPGDRFAERDVRAVLRSQHAGVRPHARRRQRPHRGQLPVRGQHVGQQRRALHRPHQRNRWNLDAGLDKAFLIDYDSSTGAFSNPTYFFDGAPGGLTHFEGIIGAAGGYNVIGIAGTGYAFASIARSQDNSFGPARWTGPLSYPGSAMTTGNTVIGNEAIGIYTLTSGSTVYAYVATVPEPSAPSLVLAGLASLAGCGWATVRRRTRA